MQEQVPVIQHIIEMKTDIAAIKAMLKPLASHETRLTGVESDVRTGKKVFGGMFSVLLLSIGTIGVWIKGVFSS